MPKVNLPVSTIETLPIPENLSGEAIEYQTLQFKTTRTNEGQQTFLSTTSGLSYDTATYTEEVDIFNKGETGLMNLFNKLYGGIGGWIINAQDFNIIEDTANTALDNSTKIIDGTTTVPNANNALIAEDSKKLNGKLPTFYAKQTDLTNVIDGTTFVTNATNSTNATKLGGNVASLYQLKADTVEVYSGSTVPSSTLGKNGDLYIQF